MEAFGAALGTNGVTFLHEETGRQGTFSEVQNKTGGLKKTLSHRLCDRMIIIYKTMI